MWFTETESIALEVFVCVMKYSGPCIYLSDIPLQIAALRLCECSTFWLQLK